MLPPASRTADAAVAAPRPLATPHPPTPHAASISKLAAARARSPPLSATYILSTAQTLSTSPRGSNPRPYVAIAAALPSLAHTLP
jgi:hypothetical protein